LIKLSAFEQVLGNPQAYKGRIVLLGGDIIEIQNLPDRTIIVVLQRPLGFNKKPKMRRMYHRVDLSFISSAFSIQLFIATGGKLP